MPSVPRKWFPGMAARPPRTGSFAPQLEVLEPRVLPATAVWTGLGNGPNWSLAANWQGGKVPAAGDDLVFPGGAARLQSNNDLTGPVGAIPYNSLSFSGSAGGHLVQGNAIVLSAGLANNSNNPTTNTVALGSLVLA